MNHLEQSKQPVRYHSMIIILHWCIATGVLFMFVSGLYMVNFEMSKADQYRLFQIHKAAGVLVLLAIIARVLTKFLTKPVDMPAVFSARDVKAARWGHFVLYACMLIMPLSGWLMVSASPFGLPTIVFDMFEWPHVPGVSRNKEIETVARAIHWYLGIAFASVLFVHIAAVVVHKKRDKLNLMKRMWWSK